MKYVVSCDKIKIWIKVERELFLNGLKLNAFDEIKKKIFHLTKSYYFSDKSFYSDVFHLIGDLGTLEYNKNESSLFYTFNPNNVILYDRVDLHFFEIWETIKLFARRAEYSRLDFAIDCDFYIDDFFYRHPFKRKEVIFKNQGKLETVYLGSRESAKMIRIYDKKAEKDGETLPYYCEGWEYVTRIELEYKEKVDEINSSTILKEFEDLQIIAKRHDLNQLLAGYDATTALHLYTFLNEPELLSLNLFGTKKTKKLRSIYKEYLKNQVKTNEPNLKNTLLDVDFLIINLNRFVETLDFKHLIRNETLK